MHDYLTVLHALDRVLDRPGDLRPALKAAALAAPASPRTPGLLTHMSDDRTLDLDEQKFLLEFPNAEVRRYAAQQQDLAPETWEWYLRFETDQATLTSLRGIAPQPELSRGAVNLLFGMPEDATEVTPDGAVQVLGSLFDGENGISPLWAEALLVRGVPDDLGTTEMSWYGDPLVDGKVHDLDLERAHPMYQLAHACSPQAPDGSVARVLTAHPELIIDNPHDNVALSWLRRLPRVPVNRSADLTFVRNAEWGDVRVCIDEVPVGLPDDEVMMWALEQSGLVGHGIPRPQDLSECWLRLNAETCTDELATALLKSLQDYPEHTARAVEILGEQFDDAVEPLLDMLDTSPKVIASIPAWLRYADEDQWVNHLGRLMKDESIRACLKTATPELLELAVQDLMDYPAAWLARPVMFLADKVGFGPEQWSRLTADHMTTMLNSGGDEHASGTQLARWLLEQVTAEHLTHPLGAIAAVELTQAKTPLGDVLSAATAVV